jgi:hypothetical protein
LQPVLNHPCLWFQNLALAKIKVSGRSWKIPKRVQINPDQEVPSLSDFLSINNNFMCIPHFAGSPLFTLVQTDTALKQAIDAKMVLLRQQWLAHHQLTLAENHLRHLCKLKSMHQENLNAIGAKLEIYSATHPENHRTLTNQKTFLENQLREIDLEQEPRCRKQILLKAQELKEIADQLSQITRYINMVQFIRTLPNPF